MSAIIHSNSLKNIENFAPKTFNEAQTQICEIITNTNIPDKDKCTLIQGMINKIREQLKKSDLSYLLNTCLVTAITEDKLEVIDCLFSLGANIECECTKGNTPIIYACQHASLPVVKYLVKMGADLTHENNFGYTAYLTAIKYNREDLLLYFFNLRGQIKEALKTSTTRVTSFMAAAESGCLHLMQNALNNMPDAHKKANDDTPIFGAISSGSIPAIEFIVKEKQYPEAMTISRKSDGLTPFMWAIIQGKEDIVKWFLDNCPNCLRTPDNEGRFPLFYAIEHQNNDIIKLLLKVDPTIAEQFPKCLIEVAKTVSNASQYEDEFTRRKNEMQDQLNQLKLILEFQPNLVNDKNSEINDALILVALNGNIEAVKYLISKGVRIKPKPFYWPKSSPFPNVSEITRKHKFKNDKNFELVHLKEYFKLFEDANKFDYDHLDVKKIIEQGIVLTCRDEYGNTVLHQAGRESRRSHGLETIKFLLKYISPYEQNDSGYNLFQVMLSSKRENPVGDVFKLYCDMIKEINSSKKEPQEKEMIIAKLKEELEALIVWAKKNHLEKRIYNEALSIAVQLDFIYGAELIHKHMPEVFSEELDDRYKRSYHRAYVTSGELELAFVDAAQYGYVHFLDFFLQIRPSLVKHGKILAKAESLYYKTINGGSRGREVSKYESALDSISAMSKAMSYGHLPAVKFLWSRGAARPEYSWYGSHVDRDRAIKSIKPEIWSFFDEVNLLHTYAKDGNLKNIKEGSEKNSEYSLNGRDSNDNTLFEVAVSTGKEELALYLLKRIGLEGVRQLNNNTFQYFLRHNCIDTMVKTFQQCIRQLKLEQHDLTSEEAFKANQELQSNLKAKIDEIVIFAEKNKLKLNYEQLAVLVDKKYWCNYARRIYNAVKDPNGEKFEKSEILTIARLIYSGNLICVRGKHGQYEFRLPSEAQVMSKGLETKEIAERDNIRSPFEMATAPYLSSQDGDFMEESEVERFSRYEAALSFASDAGVGDFATELASEMTDRNMNSSLLLSFRNKSKGNCESQSDSFTQTKVLNDEASNRSKQELSMVL